MQIPLERGFFGLAEGGRYGAGELAGLPFAADLPAVAAWLRCGVGELVLDHEVMPMEVFREAAEARWETLAQWPKDAARVRRIMRLLAAGEPPYPVFVARDDPGRFVMEGRHRLLAFWRHGLAEVPVLAAHRR